MRRAANVARKSQAKDSTQPSSVDATLPCPHGGKRQARGENHLIDRFVVPCRASRAAADPSRVGTFGNRKSPCREQRMRQPITSTLLRCCAPQQAGSGRVLLATARRRAQRGCHGKSPSSGSHGTHGTEGTAGEIPGLGTAALRREPLAVMHRSGNGKGLICRQFILGPHDNLTGFLAGISIGGLYR